MKVPKSEKLKFLKSKKFLIITGIVLIALAAVLFVGFRGRAIKTNAAAPVARTAVASKGTLSITLSGSGTVSPIKKEDIVIQVSGQVEESYLEEGKAFKAGDVLLKIKDNAAQLSIKKLENSIRQKELSKESQSYNNGALNITAPISGRITELNCKIGDTVNKGTKLMTIVDDSTLSASLTFENASVSQFSGINTVNLYLPDFMTTIVGRIKSISQNGNNVHAIITVDNPGELKSGMTVWAEAETKDGDITSTQAMLEIQNKAQIVAEASGTVSSLLAYNGQKVTKGKTLLSLTGDDLTYSIELEQLELEQAYLELDQAKKNLENYTVKAPFDGVITSVADLSEGDEVKNGTKVCTITKYDEMTFQVSIDELDITKVEVGQKVIVTCEALEDTETNPIIGRVTAIASEGSGSNGVTNYPVTITIPGREKLKSGMNVDAVIQVLEKKDTLLVPIEAVQKQGNGYIVWVKRENQTFPSDQALPSASSDASQNRPWGSGRDNGNQPFGGFPSGFNPESMTEEQREAMRQRASERSFAPQQGSDSRPIENRNQNSNQNRNQFSNSNRNQNRNQNSNQSSNASGYYSGAMPVIVTVGQYNETYIEILEGLNEGDVVVLPQIISNSSSSSGSMGIQNGFMPMGGTFVGGGGGGGGFVRPSMPSSGRRGN